MDSRLVEHDTLYEKIRTCFDDSKWLRVMRGEEDQAVRVMDPLTRAVRIVEQPFVGKVFMQHHRSRLVLCVIFYKAKERYQAVRLMNATDFCVSLPLERHNLRALVDTHVKIIESKAVGKITPLEEEEAPAIARSAVCKVVQNETWS